MWSLQSQFQALKCGTWPKKVFNLDYLVVAEWVARGGLDIAGGGGAGGYRSSGYGPSPLQGTALVLNGGDYTITVGGGGAGTSNSGS